MLKIKTFFKSSFLLFILFGGLFINSCTKELPKSIPVLTTNQINSITASTAFSGGKIVFDGNLPVKTCGVCWSKNPNPTILDNMTIDTVYNTLFTSIISSLDEDVSYYVRAYATNEAGVAYGNQLTFKTLTKTLPVLETRAPINITENSATCFGSISFDGNSEILTSGICWSTNSNPTIFDNKINTINGAKSFTFQLTDLSIGTTYYVRAFASNSKGTAYGNEQRFATIGPTVKDVDGNLYHSVTIGSQTWLIENLRTSKYRDGSSIPNVTDNSTWVNSTTGAWCSYDNNQANEIKYGKLYNWHAVKDYRNIAPIGWHVATYEEWSILGKYVKENLGTTKFVSKALAAKTDWVYDGTGCIGNNIYANNSTGFSALPSGSLLTDERYSYGQVYKSGKFQSLGVVFRCWTISENAPYLPENSSKAICFSLDNLDGNLGYASIYKSSGCVIRCVKD